MSRRVKALLLLGLLSCLVAVTQAERLWRNEGDLPAISLAELPVEARTTLDLIRHGGPFPYARDGVVFGNYEKQLPLQPRGYYHEYTVRTPGERTRGARRIVCGPLPDGSVGKGGERDDAQGARSATTGTYLEGSRESEHRATQRSARAASLPALSECYYTPDHYKTFRRIREQP